MPKGFVDTDKLAHYPFHTVATDSSSESFGGAEAKLRRAKIGGTTKQHEMLAFASCALPHSLPNKALIRQTHTLGETVIFRQRLSVFCDRDDVYGSIPDDRPWWTCAYESRDRSGVCGWMAGMFSSCYSYNLINNKTTILRKQRREVKGILGVGKVLVGKGMGHPHPRPVSQGERDEKEDVDPDDSPSLLSTNTNLRGAACESRPGAPERQKQTNRG